MLPVAVRDVQGTIVAGLRECVVEFHVEGVGALHGRSASDTDAVTWMLPRDSVAVIFDGSKNPAIIRSRTSSMSVLCYSSACGNVSCVSFDPLSVHGPIYHKGKNNGVSR